MSAMWQPMDTAPRDGSQVLAFTSGQLPYGIEWWDYGQTKWPQWLTHWTALPLQPSADPDGWEPMSTAPRTGWILASGGATRYGEPEYAITRWRDVHEGYDAEVPRWTWSNCDFPDELTHWRYLPAPPVSAASLLGVAEPADAMMKARDQ